MFLSQPRLLQQAIIEKMTDSTFAKMNQSCLSVKGFIDSRKKSMKKIHSVASVIASFRFNPNLTTILVFYNCSQIAEAKIAVENFQEEDLEQFFFKKELHRFYFHEIALDCTDNPFRYTDRIKDFLKICKRVGIACKNVKSGFAFLIEETQKALSPKKLAIDCLSIMELDFSSHEKLHLVYVTEKWLAEIFKKIAPITKSLKIEAKMIYNVESYLLTFFDLLVKRQASNPSSSNELFFSLNVFQAWRIKALTKMLQDLDHSFVYLSQLDLALVKTEEEKTFFVVTQYENANWRTGDIGYSYKMIRSFEELSSFYLKSFKFFDKNEYEESVEELLQEERFQELKKFFI